MKKLLPYILTLFFCMGFLGGCDKPRIIPDSTLRQIFKEVYLTNAYFLTNNTIKTDSLDVYNSILEKYGFNAFDLDHTVQNFSRRKSARLSDIVESAISELQQEYDWYEERVAVLDTVDARAARLFRREVYSDSVINVTAIRDTAALRVTLPVEPGTYEVTYFYEIDSLDQNKSLRTLVHVIDTAGRRNGSTTNWLNARKRTRQTAKVDAIEGDSVLVVLFGNYQDKMTRPYITIDSLSIIRYLPKQTALDSLNRLFFGYDLPQNRYYEQDQADSLALALHPDGADSTAVADGR